MFNVFVCVFLQTQLCYVVALDVNCVLSLTTVLIVVLIALLKKKKRKKRT